ncbi:MAG TPA: inorganic phosphate transporter [Armatimonadota bacterium]|nr:inorganic phosphate transporter [Armatimonadota bacterium]
MNPLNRGQELELTLLITVILIALAYDFVNGMDDCANAIATVVSTRTLTPRQAIILACVLNTAGAFITTQVAKTIGKGIVDPSNPAVTQGFIMAGLIGATLWTLGCWYLGLPTSVSHALVGGLVGVTLVRLGWQDLQMAGLIKVGIGMILAPTLGFFVGFLTLTATNWVCHLLKITPAKGTIGFRWLQILSAMYMALTHGMNDTQNAMGIITMSLVSYGVLETFHVPFWVILICGAAMGLGTYMGGWRIIRTMGMKIASLRTIHGFSAETAAATITGLASVFGLPVSTTHTITSSIMGVGSVRSLSMVRWGVAGRIIGAWVFTVPGSAIIGIVAWWIIAPFGI